MSSIAKRITLVSAFPPGRQSLNEYGLHLAKGFAAHDEVAEVLVLADQLDGPGQELDMGPKIKVQRVWAFNKPFSQWRLFRAARAAKTDAVIFNLQTASFGDKEIPAATGLMVPAVLRLFGSHVGVIAHNLIAGVDLEQTVLKGQWLRQMLIRTAGEIVTRALCAASYITVTLPAFLATLRTIAPRAKAHLVPHGTFEGSVSQPAPASTRGLYLNTMGKFGTYKRLETLLAAFDLVRQDPRFADLKLEIGGSDHPSTPGYMAALKAKWAHDPGITFLGYIAEDEVPAFFGRAALSVFDYSTTTGSSGVMHQATSNGAVPIFPLIDDFADLASSEGIKGYHYAPDDAQALATALMAAFEDRDSLDAKAASNLSAADHMPFADVIAFHMAQIPDPQ